ncbi:MAG: hypothetical protein OEZ22_13120 [Spirochaetia bacterium]|nr:hypothetical protein [Spirochaetia bacterium]
MSILNTVSTAEVSGLFLIMLVGALTFVLFNHRNKTFFELDSILNADKKSSDLLLIMSFKKMNDYSLKGRWLLFISYVILLSLTFLVLLNYTGIYENYILPLDKIDKDIQNILVIIFIIFIFSAIAFSTKLSISAKKFHSLNGGYSLSAGYLEQKLDNISDEQYKKIIFYVTEKLNVLESTYIISSIFFTLSMFIIFIVGIYWIFYLFN